MDFSFVWKKKLGRRTVKRPGRVIDFNAYSDRSSMFDWVVPLNPRKGQMFRLYTRLDKQHAKAIDYSRLTVP